MKTYKELKSENNIVACMQNIYASMGMPSEKVDIIHNTKPIKVAICAIGKLENPYIVEWVEHYKGLQVSKIFLYDNNDIEGEDIERFSDILHEYTESGLVEIVECFGEKAYQTKAYTDCYNKHNKEYDWIGFVDIDEFLDITSDDNINDWLNRKIYNNFNCVRVCWKQFTDNNITRIKDENYSVKRFKEYISLKLIEKYKNITYNNYLDSMQSKAFIRGGLGKLNINSPHGCFSDKIKSCNTLGMKCVNFIRIDKPTWNNACLNHYRFKTMEEFIKFKMKRLWPTNYQNGGKGFLNKWLFAQFNNWNEKKKQEFEKIMKEYNIK